MNSNNVTFFQAGNRTTTPSPDHKTKIIFVILVLYLAYLVPLGIICLQIVVYGLPFKDFVVDYMWFMFDFFAILNSSIMFSLLVTMSERFRRTFLSMFWHANQSVRRSSAVESKATTDTSLEMSSVGRIKDSTPSSPLIPVAGSSEGRVAGAKEINLSIRLDRNHGATVDSSNESNVGQASNIDATFNRLLSMMEDV